MSSFSNDYHQLDFDKVEVLVSIHRTFSRKTAANASRLGNAIAIMTLVIARHRHTA